MIDLLKKTLLAGVGATVITKERLEAALNELVDKGKLTADDVRSAADKIMNEGKTEYEEARHSLQELFDDLLARANVAKNKDLAALRARVEHLEKQVADVSAAATTAAAGGEEPQNS